MHSKAELVRPDEQLYDEPGRGYMQALLIISKLKKERKQYVRKVPGLYSLFTGY